MKHYKRLNGLIIGFLTLLAFTIASCEKEDITTQEPEAITSKNRTKVTLFKAKDIANNKGLMRILNDAEIKRQHSKANKTIYNEQYDFTINTNYAKVIANANGTHNYTFGVSREEDNGLLENLLLKEQTDGTFLVYLVVYDINETERNSLANKDIVDVENKITYSPLEDISSSIFSKVNSDAETCTVYSYEWEGGSLCTANGNHSYEDGGYSDSNPGGCHAWNNPDLAATQGGWNLTSNEVDCGSGDSTNTETDNNNTNTNQNNNNTTSNGSGNYTPSPDTEVVLCTDCPEVEEEEDCLPIPPQLLNQLEAAFGSGNVNLECDTPIDDVQFFSVEELQQFFENFINQPSVDSENIDDGDTKKNIQYFRLQTIPAIVNLKTIVKYEVPNSIQCMNLLRVDTSLNGNESLAYWSSDDIPTAPTSQTDYENDVVTIQLSGSLKTGLKVPGFDKVIGITQSIELELRYKHTSGAYLGGGITDTN